MKNINLLRDWPALLLWLATSPVLAEPCTLYKARNIAIARANVERHDWAKSLLCGYQQAASNVGLPQRSEYYPGWQVGVLRSGNDSSQTAFYFNGYAAHGHRHSDTLGILYHAFNQELASDRGYFPNARLAPLPSSMLLLATMAVAFLERILNIENHSFSPASDVERAGKKRFPRGFNHATARSCCRFVPHRIGTLRSRVGSESRRRFFKRFGDLACAVPGGPRGPDSTRSAGS